MRLSQAYENALVAWIKSVLPSNTVVWDKQAHARPSLPYVTLNIMSAGNFEPVNAPNSVRTSQDNFSQSLAETMTVTVEVFSDSYYSDMRLVKKSIYNPIARSALSTAGLTIKTAGNVIDLSQLVDTEYEYRCACDFVFGYRATDTAINTGEITRVSGTVLDEEFDEQQP